MREILFRGKDTQTGEWVQGYFVGITNNEAAIIPFDKVDYDVGYIRDCECSYCNIETVGQSIGLLDKNGKEIYEGDIITFDNHLQGISQVVYDYAGFDVVSNNYRTTLRPMMNNHIRVIGNIHDNPELLKAETL